MASSIGCRDAVPTANCFYYTFCFIPKLLWLLAAADVICAIYRVLSQLQIASTTFSASSPSCKDRPIHPPTVYIYNNLRHTNDYFDDTLSLSLLRVLLCAVYITNQFTHLRLTTVYNTYLYGFALLGMGEEKDWLHD